VFWGYQLFIVMAATGYLLGITQAANMPSRNGMSTSGSPSSGSPTSRLPGHDPAKRKEPHIYVANWFYLSFIVTIAMLHLVNNLAIRSVSRLKELFAFSGVQDA
jgi:cytochrome c oxidase cbb3-type subunit 1